MAAYYNEIEPYAAQWLRNLIQAGLIADGEVDERSIKDVRPDDLREFTQCHFFSGIGGWSYALRLAGWPDDRPAWTGSCPCQPFSSAGKGAGTADERHLWPAWFHLIEQCRPPTIFGEQVDAAIKHGWLDLVQDDLEVIGYTVGAVGLPAAGFGAPHIRHRLWFVAHSDPERSLQYAQLCKKPGNHSEVAGSCEAGFVADSDDAGSQGRSERWDGSEQRTIGESGVGSFWFDVEWIACRDGKSRPAQPGIFPLAHGVSNRVGRLRAYGNAIVPQVAQAFIIAYMECMP